MLPDSKVQEVILTKLRVRAARRDLRVRQVLRVAQVRSLSVRAVLTDLRVLPDSKVQEVILTKLRVRAARRDLRVLQALRAREVLSLSEHAERTALRALQALRAQGVPRTTLRVHAANKVLRARRVFRVRLAYVVQLELPAFLGKTVLSFLSLKQELPKDISSERTQQMADGMERYTYRPHTSKAVSSIRVQMKDGRISLEMFPLTSTRLKIFLRSITSGRAKAKTEKSKSVLRHRNSSNSSLNW